MGFVLNVLYLSCQCNYDLKLIDVYKSKNSSTTKRYSHIKEHQARHFRVFKRTNRLCVWTEQICEHLTWKWNLNDIQYNVYKQHCKIHRTVPLCKEFRGKSDKKRLVCYKI